MRVAIVSAAALGGDWTAETHTFTVAERRAALIAEQDALIAAAQAKRARFAAMSDEDVRVATHEALHRARFRLAAGRTRRR